MAVLVPALAGFFGGVIGASLVLYLFTRDRRPASSESPTFGRLRQTTSSWKKP